MGSLITDTLVNLFGASRRGEEERADLRSHPVLLQNHIITRRLCHDFDQVRPRAFKDL